MKKKLSKLLSLAMAVAFVLPGYSYASATEISYPEITAEQNDNGTFVSMNGTLICELEENRYLRFRSCDKDDNWIGSEKSGADLGIGYSDDGVKGIVIENAEFVNNTSKKWFEVSVNGYKEGLDCQIDYRIRGTWDSAIGKFKYTYETNMNADLEKWYENSIVAQNAYNNNPNNKARIEITDYHIEGVSYPDIYSSESYNDMELRYEYFLASYDGNTWEKYPKIHTPEPIRKGDYITIVDKSNYSVEGSKFGFTDSEYGGWITTIKESSSKIWYSLCWYFWDVHIFATDAVPPRGSSDRFDLSFTLDFEPISKSEGQEIVDNATERNWREQEEYQLPLFTRNNTFDTLISDNTVPSEETGEHNIWWASSYDCYRDDTTGYDDSYSVTIKRDGNPTKPDAWNTFMWGPEVEKNNEPIKNHKYRLSAMVKTENCTGDVRIGYATRSNEGDFFYGTNTHNSDGTPITNGNISWYFSKAITGTNDWTELSIEFTVTKRRNSILLEQNGSGQCWFDNVVLEDLGEVTNDSYYICENYEENVGNWKVHSNAQGNIIDGAYVLTPETVGSEIAETRYTINPYSGKWIAEFEASAATNKGTILACMSVFMLEINYNDDIIVKSSDQNGNSVNTTIITDYIHGTPIKFKAVMDFDTKEFEFYYNGNKANLGVGNYIRNQSITELQRFVSLINAGYSGNITLYDFMLYADSDEGSVNITKAALDIGNASAYKNNIQLPVTGMNGTEIQWSSSDESIVNKDGTIYRSDESGYADLTAIISKNEATATKKFPVRVAPYGGITFRTDYVKAYSDRTTANVEVTYDSDDIYSKPAIIMACYKDNDLIGVILQNIDFDNEINNYTVTATHTASPDIAEFFLWDMEKLYPISQKLVQTFSTQIVFETEKACAEVGEPVKYEVYKLHGESKTPLHKDEYSIEQYDLIVDYDNNTLTFMSDGIKEVKLSSSCGVYSNTIAVNDSDSTVYVKGTNKFQSDFSGDNALDTYLTAGGTGYSITSTSDGKNALTTLKSTAVDTLLFGPELTDYNVEMDFVPTRLSGSGVNYLAIGLRAQDKAKPPAYRVGVFERDKFRGSEILYNRLGIGRGEKPLSGAWHFGNISATPFNDGTAFVLNEKYKLSASIIEDKIFGTLYDKNGNVIDTISANVSDCNYSESGKATATMTSGKTILSFQCMVADISDIKIFDFDSIGKISISQPTGTINIGDSINLHTSAEATELDNSMVEYTAVSGFDIKGNTATATASGNHTIIAQYTDYSGKTKHTAIRIKVN